MGVLLDQDSGDELPVDDGEFVQAAFYVEDEDECVFEGADLSAGDPAAVDGFAEDAGGAAYLHGCVEVALEQLLGVFAIEGPGWRWVFFLVRRRRLGCLELAALDVVDCGGEQLWGGRGPGPDEREREGGAHWAPAAQLAATG